MESLLVLALLLAPAGGTLEEGPVALVGGCVVTTAGADAAGDSVVVVRDGRVHAVGTAAELPGDARAIDVAGLTLTHALVDASWWAGLEFGAHVRHQGRAADDTRDTLAAMGIGDRTGLAPERRAEAGLGPAGTDLVEHRKSGFGAVLVTPSGMLLAGRAAWLVPAGQPARESWLATDVAQCGALSWRSGPEDYAGSAYPSTLMGVMAHLRQVLLDAQHQALIVQRAAERKTLARPPRDEGLDALQAVLEGRQPLLIEAREEEDIRLALGLGQEFPGLRLVIAGGDEAWRLAPELAAAGVGVVLALDFPEEPDAPAEAEDAAVAPPAPGAGPELSSPPRRGPPYGDPIPERLVGDRHARWIDRVAGARRLRDADVALAFGSFGGGPETLRKGVQTAIEDGGLTADEALDVLTRGPRRVLGHGAPVGEIRQDEPALLAAWKGEPLAKDSEVKVLVIDGRVFDLRSAAERRGEASDEPADGDPVADAAVPDPPAPDAATEASPAEGDPAEVAFLTTADPAAEAADVKAAPQREHPARTPYEVALGAAAAAATGVEWPVELDDDRRPSLGPAGPVLLRGANLLTVSSGVLLETDLLLRDGKIAALGRGLELPDGGTALDVSGRWILPGVIDAHAHIAIRGGINEWTRNITPEVTIADEVDPDDVGIYRALAGGTTTARLLHGSANAIGGRHEVIKLRWSERAKGLVFEGARPGVKFALGENPRQANWGDGSRFPKTRMGVEASLRRAFGAGQDYAAEWARFAAAEAQGEQPDPPRRDLRLEALAGILRGEIDVHSHCYRAHEVLMLIGLAEEFGFQIQTFQHVLEAYKVAREIHAHGGGGCSTFIDWWGFKFEAYDGTPYNPALVHEAGVPMSINSDSDDHIRRLNLEAAKAVKYGGVDENDALAMVTLVPARQLGLDDRVGSLDLGKDGDLAVYDRHPFDTRARVELVFVDGVLRFERRADAYVAWEAELAGRIGAGQRARAALDEPGAATLPAPHPLELRSRSVDDAALDALGLTRDGTAAASTPARPPAPALALVGGTVHTLERRDGVLVVLRPGAVLMRDGRIVDVLPGTPPAAWLESSGYSVRDVTGLSVWPGLVDGGSTIGLGEIGLVRQSMDVHEPGRDQADLRASTAWHPASETIPVARVNGVTSALVVPSGEGVMGQSAVMALEGWTAAEALVLDRAALHVGVPRVDRHEKQDKLDTAPAAGCRCDEDAGGPPVAAMAIATAFEKPDGDLDKPADPADLVRRLDEAWEPLTRALADAREYARQAGLAVAGAANPPAHDPRLEAMAPFALGRGKVHFHCDLADQIADALDFADREGLDAVIVGGRDAWKVADRIALAGVPVLVGPVFALPGGRDERYDSVYANAGVLHRAGVRIGFRSADNHDARNLPYHAAMAVAFGLDEDAALEALTAGTAGILGLEQELGRLMPGLRADVLVTDGSPLQIRTGIRAVFIGGRDVGLESRHTRLYETYRERLLAPGRVSGG